MTTGIDAVLFDFSETLFRLEPRQSWFAGAGGIPEPDRQRAIVRRLTAPVAEGVPMTARQRECWERRDLDARAHRESFLHILAASGVAADFGARLYARVTDPASWTPFPDAAAALRLVRDAGMRIGIVSNIAFDIRPACDRIADRSSIGAFTLSFECGLLKPDPRIFRTALRDLGVRPERTVMVGDSVPLDGAARAVGARFVPVVPQAIAERPDGLLRALAEHDVVPRPGDRNHPDRKMTSA